MTLIYHQSIFISKFAFVVLKIVTSMNNAGLIAVLMAVHTVCIDCTKPMYMLSNTLGHVI